MLAPSPLSPTGAVYGPTAGISRNLAGPYESEDGGGDINGTAARSIFHGQAGTPAGRLSVPRALQFQTSGSQMQEDTVPEAPATGLPYARNGAIAAWVLLADTPQQIAVVGTGWAANQYLTWRFLDGGASMQISGVLLRTAGNNIPPGAGNNVILCTLPFAPLSQQMQVCPALAQTGLGSLPGDQLSYGYLLFGPPGTLAFYATARNDDPPAHAGTTTIYVSNTFPVTMPASAFTIPEPNVPVFRGGMDDQPSRYLWATRSPFVRRWWKNFSGWRETQ